MIFGLLFVEALAAAVGLAQCSSVNYANQYLAVLVRIPVAVVVAVITVIQAIKAVVKKEGRGRLPGIIVGAIVLYLLVSILLHMFQ